MKLCTALVLLLAVSASAVTVNLNPSADAFVSSANPTSNYGGAGALEVSAAGLARGEFESVLRFDFSTAKTNFDTTFGAGQWMIDSITLQLTSALPNNGIFNANSAGLFTLKWMQNDSWVEGTGTPAAPGATGITFNTYTSFLSLADESLGAFSFGGGDSGNNTWSLALTPFFLADATGGKLVGFSMAPGDGAVSYLSNSRSFGTVASRPTLAVNAVATPEPASCAFLAAAALACFASRRRHARAA